MDENAVSEPSEGSSLRIDTVTSADRVVVLVRGDVDSATSPQLRAVVDAMLRDGVSELELDLSDLTFLDSTGLGVIAHAVRELQAIDGVLTLHEVPAMVRRLLFVTDLERFVRISDPS